MGLLPPAAPLLVSHRRTEVSKPPDTTTEALSPAKRTALTRAVWPWVAEPKRRMVVAVATSQRKTARSPPEETKRSLSGATARERTS